MNKARSCHCDPERSRGGSNLIRQIAASARGGLAMTATKKLLLAAFAALIIAVPAVSLAAAPIQSKWETPDATTVFNSPDLQPQPTQSTSAATICDNLFVGDPDNIYRVTICDLVKIVAISVSNFARDMTCTIQQVGNGGNYQQNVKFTSGDGLCKAGSWTTITPATESRLTSSLRSDPKNLKSGLRETDTGSPPDTIPKIYAVSRNVVSVLIVIALLFFAFASILHIDLNTYSVKKALPAVIFALGGAWLAIYLVFLVSRSVDFLFSLNIFSPVHAFHPMQNIFGGALSATVSDTSIEVPTTSSAMALVFQVGGQLLGSPNSITLAAGFLGTILLVIPSIVVFAFEYVMGIRPLVVGFLTAIAPFAFVCTIFPQTQFLFRKWWTILVIALFYAPVVNFVFFILNALPATYWAESGAAGFAILWLFKIAVIVFLIRLPFTIENDLKRLTVTLAKTGFGSALGLGKIATAIEQSKKQGSEKTVATTITDKIFSKESAKKIIADTTLKDISRQVTRTAQVTQTGGNLPKDMSVVAISKIASTANQTNLSRPVNLLARSVADLTPDTFKTVISKSDPQLWRDTRLIEQLKDKNGQTLDNEGAATRADSSRKIVRFAEAVENGKLKNPEAVKLLAQKGALDAVPLYVVKKALEEQVINQADLVPTFKNQSGNTMKRLETIETKNIRFSDSKTVQSQIVTDHDDYRSGYKDVSNIIAQVSANPQVSQISPQLAKTIASQIKNSNSDSLKDYGEYFVRRLGQEQKVSQSAITAALQKLGAQKPIAEAIGGNMKIGFARASVYVPKPQQTQANLDPLRSAFATRDLAYSLGSEISHQVVENKTALARGITQKISNTLKAEPNMDLGQIKSTLKASLEKLSKPLSPQEAEALSKDIEKFHPSATLKIGAEFTESDIENTKEKASDVLETVNQLESAGQDKTNVMSKPEEAIQAIGTKIKETVQKAANGPEPQKQAT